MVQDTSLGSHAIYRMVSLQMTLEWSHTWVSWSCYFWKVNMSKRSTSATDLL